jgi:hypothetical protein
VQEYRVYPLGVSGKINGPSRDIDADDDTQALNIASDIFKGHASEVWRGTHLVAEPKPRARSLGLKRLFIRERSARK